MKRHSSLAHLSREHHGALILSRLLQKNAPVYNGLPVDTAGKAAYAIKFYKEELIEHFEKEEQALLLVKGVNEPLDLMVQTIFDEHLWLHEAFKSIPTNHDLPAHLDKLGHALEIHVRKEERELFPYIQKSCSEELMSAIEAFLSSFMIK